MKYLLLSKVLCCIGASLIAQAAFAVVAQEPLLSKTVNVRPNIALILDTSGSMDWECVYAKHVNDAMTKDGLGASNIPGLTTGCWASTDMRQASPVNNLLYYNPKTTYIPGYVKGVQQTNATVGSTSIVTLYLPIPPKDPTTYTTSAAIKSTTNYDSYDVTTTGFKKKGIVISGTSGSVNPFGTHGGSRTDCTGDPCTFAEERINIANWLKYHYKRLLAAQTGLSGAFATQTDNFRLAYADIYSSAPGIMTDFGVAQTAFYTWLDGRVASGGTPLKTALDNAGKYYQSTANTGPWGSKPWSPPTSEKATDHLSCRRSYTLMITDGFYNDPSPPAVGNIDVSSATDIHKYALTATTFDTNKTYRYKPGDTSDVRNKGKSDSATSSGGYSDTLADIAMKYWVTDLRPDLLDNNGNGSPSDPPFWQNMTTYMISFGAPGSMTEADVIKAKAGTLAWVKPTADTYTAIDDMRHASHNAGGSYLSVTDAAKFASDLGNVIGSIASQQFSQAGVAASAVTLTSGTNKFVPYYTSGTWWGNVQMIDLTASGDSNAVAWQVVATDVNGQPTGVTTIPTPTTRNIVVWANATSQAIDFSFTNITTGSNNFKGSNANMQLSTAVTSDQVDYLRGVRTKEGNPMRKRQAILGDIVNSTPVFIKNNSNPQYELLPATTPGISGYAAYMSIKAARTEGALLAGANDGMLHVFAEGYGANVGGREVFAYVPRSVLGKMEALTASGYSYAHTFTVDGPLAETDLYAPAISGAAGGWRNVVLGTTGAGAKAVFALDVSSPLKMNGKSVLWEINADPGFPMLSGNVSTTFQELGNVLSPVQSGITVSGNWVSIFGNGYDSKSGKASLFVVETATGKLIQQIATDSVTGNGLGGVRLVFNSAKQIIGAYAGDLKGRVWKFDLSGSASSSWALGNGGVPLFTAMSGATVLPITAQPAVLERTDQAAYKPSYLVSVSTGKLFEAADPATTTPTQYAYGLWDRKPFGSTLSDTINDVDLEALKASQVTSGINAGTGSSVNAGGITSFYTVNFANVAVQATGMNWTTRRGWKLPLDIFTGQRDVYPLQMVGTLVKIDTIAPQTATNSCQSTTSNALSFYIDPLSAICRTGGTLDTNGDGLINSQDTNVCAYTTGADGMDVVLNILDSLGRDTGIKDIQNSTGHIKIRASDGANETCTDAGYAAANPAECGCANAAYAASHTATCNKIKSRAWRQIFPRVN